MSYRIAEWQGSGIHVLVTQRQSDPDPEVSLSFTGKRFCKVEHNGRHFVNPDYVNLEGMAQLADIIVRGIRSLEEERRMRLSKCGGLTPGATVEQLVDEGEEAVDALYRLMPGLGDSGEELEPVIEDWGED